MVQAQAGNLQAHSIQHTEAHDRLSSVKSQSLVSELIISSLNLSGLVRVVLV